MYLFDTLILVSVLIYLLYKFTTRNFNYWHKKRVFYIEPVPFFGNFLDISLFKITIGEYLARLYRQTREPFFGIYVFNEPHLIIKSPELIKRILVKDFDYFDDRTIASPQHDQLVSSLLFVNKNPEWRAVRVKMTPIFTSGKLKCMMPLMNDVGERMKKYIAKQIPHSSLEAKEICAKYSTDVIAICAFAINAHSFDSEDAEFRKIGRMVFDFRWSLAVRQTSYFFLPTLVKLFRLDFLDREVIDFLRNVFWSAIEKRKKETNNSQSKGKDLIDAIIELKDDKEFCTRTKFEGDKVVSQAVQFFLAGFETTSSTMAFALYELCLHPHIQTKLRKEIKKTVEEHGFTYETIQRMKYLHMCVCEALRKYPVLPFLDRRCKFDYKIPGSDIVIDKGTPIYIPMFGLHYDEEFFENPQEYNPERFSDEHLDKIKPFSYMPFGEGPRNCIGERFGLLGTKLGLIHILSEFEVERSEDTPVPIKFDPKGFVLTSKTGLPMKFKKITPNIANMS